MTRQQLKTVKIMSREYRFPVYGTQGGGLVRQIGDKFIFMTKPDCPGLDVGDEMPREWGIAAANDLALQENEHEQDMFRTAADELFGLLFEMRDNGAITSDQMGEFFPEEVRNRT